MGKCGVMAVVNPKTERQHRDNIMNIQVKRGPLRQPTVKKASSRLALQKTALIHANKSLIQGNSNATQVQIRKVSQHRPSKKLICK